MQQGRYSREDEFSQSDEEIPCEMDPVMNGGEGDDTPEQMMFGVGSSSINFLEESVIDQKLRKRTYMNDKNSV